MSNSKCVYYKEKEQKSIDGGITWVDTGNFRKGALISTQASQCGSFTDEYRWIKADYVCDNGNKYKGYKQQVSHDNGGSWVDTGVVNIGDLIEENSKDCPPPSMKVTYVDGTSKTFYDLTRIEQNTDSNKAIAKSVEVYDGVTSIGNSAFENCLRLTNIVIPDSVTSIGSNAFLGCYAIRDITLPNSITEIGVLAFSNCSGLESVVLPNSLTSIGQSVFMTCSNLTSVVISNSVTKIGTEAFADCTSLSSITLPDSVTSIGHWAFFGCSGLTTMTVEATNPPYLESYAIPDTISRIYVPAASVNSYKSARGWKDYANSIQAIPQ